MEKIRCGIFPLAILIWLLTICTNSNATQFSGSANTEAYSIQISFSDTNAVNIIKKGIYDNYGNPIIYVGEHTFSYVTAHLYEEDNWSMQRVISGNVTETIPGRVSISAGNSFTDIANTPFNSNIYDNIRYQTSSSGNGEISNAYELSQAAICDLWLFNVVAPVDIAFNYSYSSFASNAQWIPDSTSELNTYNIYSRGSIFAGIKNGSTYERLSGGSGFNNWNGSQAGTLSLLKHYDAGSTGYIGLEIFSMVLATNQNSQSTVPEPSTMLLLALGLIGLSGIRRKYNN